MIPALLLAAGASQRLGRPKALLPFRGSTLVEQAAETLLAAECSPVLVVIGPEAERIRARIRGLAVEVIECAASREGMSASIRTGIEALRDAVPAASGLVLALVDQPRMSPELVRRLVVEGGAGGLAASDYGDAIGPPAYFGRDLLGELASLTGDRGAKRVLQAHRDRLRLVPFPGGALDVDREADYERLLSGS